tara:strand:- start:31061 stop:31510 length:450 start_codon:yes stop_codon:yes gene_type:complete
MKKWFLAVIFSSLALAGCKDGKEGEEDKGTGTAVEEQTVKQDGDASSETKPADTSESKPDTGASINTDLGERLAMADEAVDVDMSAETEEANAMADSMKGQEGNDSVATEEAQGVNSDAEEEEDKTDAEDVEEDASEDEAEEEEENGDL